MKPKSEFQRVKRQLLPIHPDLAAAKLRQNFVTTKISMESFEWDVFQPIFPKIILPAQGLAHLVINLSVFIYP